MNRAEQLANDHWSDYIEPLIEAHNIPPVEIKMCGFHYRSAFIHGYKHALQDVELDNDCTDAVKQPYVHQNIESIIDKAHQANKDINKTLDEVLLCCEADASYG